MEPSQTKTLSVGDVNVRYLDTGADGSGVVLAHCSSGSHRQWSFLLPALAAGHRVLAPDLLGYGGSTPWPAVEPWPAARDHDVLEAMIEKAGGPVHLIGHSYGAAICLEVARRDRERKQRRVLSLCLVEPVAFHLLRTPEANPYWQVVERLSERVQRCVGRGHLKAAASAFMGFWLGRSQWMFAPRRFRTRAMRTMPKVAAEFQLLSESRAALSEHSGIDCPVTLIEGSRSPLVARAVVRALASTLPDVRVVELEGAGHMSPFTHPERVRALVIAHLARAPAPRNVLPVAAQERLSA